MFIPKILQLCLKMIKVPQTFSQCSLTSHTPTLQSFSFLLQLHTFLSSSYCLQPIQSLCEIQDFNKEIIIQNWFVYARDWIWIPINSLWHTWSPYLYFSFFSSPGLLDSVECIAAVLVLRVMVWGFLSKYRLSNYFT